MHKILVKLDVNYLNTLILYERQLSLAEFAKLIHFSKTHVYDILNMKRKPSLDFVNNTIHYLNLTLEERFRLIYSLPEETAAQLANTIRPLESLPTNN